MPNIITVSKSRQKFGVVGLAVRARKNAPPAVASVKAAVSDGDTVSSHPYDNLGVRFLGVDAPEKGLPDPNDPKDRAFYALWSEPKQRKRGEKAGKNDDGLLWTRFLKTRALQQYRVGLAEGEMDPELQAHLAARLTSAAEGAAFNHRFHALGADKGLTEEIQKDLKVMRQKPETFRFFLAFAYDIMDGFGRLLCYINRNQTDEKRREEDRRKKTDQYYYYQERLLRAGLVNPYFIWPNVDPFIRRTQGTSALTGAVLTPAAVATLDRDADRLAEARRFVREARTNRLGIFGSHGTAGPLAIEAQELRFLGRGNLPRRWVIDLSARRSQDDYYGVLIEPQKYFYVKNPEDRLYVPEEFVPLFLLQENGKPKYGWQTRAQRALAPGRPGAAPAPAIG